MHDLDVQQQAASGTNPCTAELQAALAPEREKDKDRAAKETAPTSAAVTDVEETRVKAGAAVGEKATAFQAAVLPAASGADVGAGEGRYSLVGAGADSPGGTAVKRVELISREKNASKASSRKQGQPERRNQERELPMQLDGSNMDGRIVSKGTSLSNACLLTRQEQVRSGMRDMYSPHLSHAAAAERQSTATVPVAPAVASAAAVGTLADNMAAAAMRLPPPGAPAQASGVHHDTLTQHNIPCPRAQLLD